MRLVRGRLAAVSVRASFLAGMWVGITLGLVLGSILGALLVWGAGATLGWQRDLAFTLGVARALLPLGDQVAALRWVTSNWFLVIPATAMVVALVAGVVGGLIGALLAALYNRSPRHATVVVEIPDLVEEPTAAVAADATPRRGRGGTRRGREGGRGGAPTPPP
jgi:F0F1-type ATP synthase assembly protein I